MDRTLQSSHYAAQLGVMAIVGTRPESGIRIELELRSSEPCEYVGRAQTPDADYTIVVRPDHSGGEVTGVSEDVAEKVRLLVRAALRHAEADGRPPPPRIARWRPA